MTRLICVSCGANDFRVERGFYVCNYCNTKHEVSEHSGSGFCACNYYDTKPEIKKQHSTNISLRSDVEALLEKCQSEPKNARKYANLILDIDPMCQEAYKYL